MSEGDESAEPFGSGESTKGGQSGGLEDYWREFYGRVHRRMEVASRPSLTRSVLVSTIAAWVGLTMLRLALDIRAGESFYYIGLVDIVFVGDLMVMSGTPDISIFGGVWDLVFAIPLISIWIGASVWHATAPLVTKEATFQKNLKEYERTKVAKLTGEGILVLLSPFIIVVSISVALAIVSIVINIAVGLLIVIIILAILAGAAAGGSAGSAASKINEFLGSK